METKKSIMIVDDDAVVRAGLRELIGLSGLFTINGEASRGDDFLSMIKEKPETEFAILDLSMPGLYGTVVARKALEINPVLRIMIFSAYVDKSELSMLLEMGIFGYILKTEGFDQILKALTNAATGAPYFSPELVGQVLMRNTVHTEKVEFTPRETEILAFMCKGLSVEEIAGELFVSSRTIEKHRTNMLSRANKKSTLELVLYAIKNGIVPYNSIDHKSVS
ncbi:MAG: response regulator transcription factor [Bacteroidales bacterium]|jgi:DNA-binding NarL/FixJ family response regulator|nr:response regulator transcription factor [Bacteroidales bacterium]